LYHTVLYRSTSIT